MRTSVLGDAVRTASGRGEPSGALASSPAEQLATVRTALVGRTRLTAFAGRAGFDPAPVGGVFVGRMSLNHDEFTGGRDGLPTMCEGGGMADAVIIERP